MRRVTTLAVCALLLTAGCLGGGTFPATDSSTDDATETAPTPQNPTTPSSSLYDVDVDRIEDLIHQKMNERREENGVEPLARNESLNAVARYKSWDMAQRDYFAHTGPNGTTHIDLRTRYSSSCGYMGQNLAQKWGLQKINNRQYSEKNIASNIVGGLLNSSGHRENALSPNYDSQGIGVFVDENGTVFVTQELCG